ncbi:hypothetical protein [Mucilaginibacter rubeus]|uniref:DUF2007 domain-containing protein n=1 Tax=Mucilaginibacter rubeus TaxID=2027860 RepID=A0A5C1I661_9SPHI|nr:hypothetical protein [Mucilaginibacter rubeus]QEM13597.1 hypothetical protein DEO27_027490 [Mucilaginibacter rubeus]
MQPEFITFKKFDDPALAQALTDLLEEAGIEHQTEKGGFSFDPTFAASAELSTEYRVKISADDFTRANELLNASEAEDIKHVDKSYYLFSFTNAELMEILEKADEWSSFDHQLARKLLAERDVDVSDQKLAEINQNRIDELKAPESTQREWVIIGYIFALMGGVLGIFIGWMLSSHKKTLPTGEKVFVYSEADRRQGKNILYISIVVTVIAVAYRVIRDMTMQ